jgi:RNA polymerase sigma factor (sigma-70 family)
MANGQLTRVLRHLRRLVTGNDGDATDQQLLERFAADHDQAAFTALVRRHGPMVHGVCRRVLGNCHDADDAFQATFLVLAKKAGAVAWRASIGNWLYGVAYRTASKVRVQGARRGRHEQAAAGQNSAVVEEHPEARELRQVLDEELIRLPERYRMPVLLCCLHDQTIDEAAQQLGWTFAKVKGRVQRGRELLRSRLQRRGIALSAGVLGTLLGEGAVSAAPAALTESTVQAVAGGTTSPAVAALVKGVSRAMFWNKIKIGAAVLAVLAVVGAGGIGLSRLGTGPAAALAVPVPDKEKQPEEPKASKPILKNGLEVVIKPTQAVFAVGQAPTLDITYTARGKQGVSLYDIDYAVAYWTCVDVKNDGPWQAGPYEYSARTARRGVVLEPEKSHVSSVTLMGPFSWKGAQLETPAPLKELRAGKYRVRAHIRFNPPEDLGGFRRWRLWSGEITTEPVEVVVADKTENVGDAVRQLPAEVRGQKVLAVFTREARPKDDEVRDALKKADVKVLQQVDDDGQPGALRLVLDFGGKDAEKVLADVPRFHGAIVFQDGKYVRGLAPKERNGQVPAAYAYRSWAGVPATQKQRETDLAALRAIPGIKVDFHNRIQGRPLLGGADS